MANSKTIGLVVILVIILAGAYLMFFPASDSSFDSGFEDLSFIWLGRGVDVKIVDFDDDVLVASLTSEQVSEIKSELIEFRSGLKGNSDDVKALRKLSEINSNLAELVEKTIVLTEASEEFDFNFWDYEGLCVDSLSDFEEVTSQGDSIISLAEENNSLIESFNSSYSSKFGVNASNLVFETSGIQSSLASLKAKRSEFASFCEVGQ